MRTHWDAAEAEASRRAGLLTSTIRGARRSTTTVVILAVTVTLSVFVLPRMSVGGDVGAVSTLDLGRGTPTPGAATAETIGKNVDGFFVEGQSRGGVRVPIPFGPPGRNERALLEITAYGTPDVKTELFVLGRGSRRRLGVADTWTGRQVDVSEEARSGSLRLEAAAENRGEEPVLFLDRIVAIRAPRDSRSDAEPWLVGLWAGLLSTALLQLVHRLLRHWWLAVLLGLAGAVLWSPVLDRAVTPLDGEAAPLWAAATQAKWLGLESGLLSGSFDSLSPLAVQLFHLLTPITGTGSAGARAASVLLALAALVAVYIVGNRVAGRIGAVLATSLALLADPFRGAAVSGEATTSLILAAAVFLGAIHVGLARTRRQEAVLVGMAGALAALGDPLWLPGVIAVAAILVIAYGERRDRLKTLGVCLLTLLLLLLPNRISVAHQHEGDFFADLTQRATFARNAELLESGRRAPGGLAPDGQNKRRQVGLGEYLLVDHSIDVLVRGIVSGGYDSLRGGAEREETRLLGLLGFVASLVGVLYLLVLPRLRLVALLPVLLAAPVLFFASRGAVPPYPAGAAFWPSFFVAGGVLAYATLKWLSGRWPLDAVLRARDRTSTWKRLAPHRLRSSCQTPARG
jgi:hypothetical protein